MVDGDDARLGVRFLDLVVAVESVPRVRHSGSFFGSPDDHGRFVRNDRLCSCCRTITRRRLCSCCRIMVGDCRRARLHPPEVQHCSSAASRRCRPADSDSPKAAAEAAPCMQ
jgi:hypothetical protein